MKVVVTEGQGRLWLDEAPEPELGPCDCLVRMECCAFCNSTDRHIIEGSAFKLAYPAILGHESVGTIERVGPAVRNWVPGDRVLRAYAAYPDERLGPWRSAWGGFAQWGKITDWAAMPEATQPLRYQQKVPADIDPLRAVLLIPQKEVYSATARIEAVRGRRFLVAGAGIVGLLFGLFLRRRGAAQVTVVARRQEALQRVLDAHAADDVHHFEQGPPEPRGYDALVETTGAIEAAASLLPALRPGAAIHAYAVYPGGAANPQLALLQQGYAFARLNPDEPAPHDEVCQLVLSGELDHRALISHVLPASEVETAWQTVRQGALKTVLRFDQPLES